MVGRSTRRRNQRVGRRDFYHFPKTKRAQNGRRRNKAKGLGVEKIKAQVQNPVRGGAWVLYEEERHTRFSFASIKSKSIRKGTLARPLGNTPRRLFFVSRNGGRISRKSRNGLRPHLERRQSRLTRIFRVCAAGAEIVRFVGFVEKR